ncbi:hypothetical protein EDB80DRAFT_875572 [Ilyonectria destructans]|nr:hypothetical protein EDB80DRAFT_875572 [Ilyonectria destructans]
MQRRNGNPAEAPPFSIRLLEHENEHAGELRLSRLNKIYEFSQTPLRGYMPRWNQYGTFFHDNFAWLASATAYIVIVRKSISKAGPKVYPDPNYPPNAC